MSVPAGCRCLESLVLAAKNDRKSWVLFSQCLLSCHGLKSTVRCRCHLKKIVPLYS